jgi:hypothetical protein
MMQNRSTGARGPASAPLHPLGPLESGESHLDRSKPQAGGAYPSRAREGLPGDDRRPPLYDACQDLFRRYPQAINTDACDGLQSIVLILHDLREVRFFVLSRDRRTGMPRYSIKAWQGESVADIEGNGTGGVPDTFVKAVTSGVPMPSDGSLFGWKSGGMITALVAFYTEYTPVCPEPSWSMMPLAGIPETRWPPFKGRRFLGRWFWEHCRAGSVVSLGGLIAGVPNTVFWAYTEAILESGCCVVLRDVKSPEGYVLRRGCYVFYQALRSGKPVPQLDTLLKDYSTVDLAPRFQQ